MPTVSCGIFAFVLGLVLAPVALWGLRRRGILDIPNERSSHRVATPRGGGVAPALAATLALALSSQLTGSGRVALLLTAVGMGAIGLVEDLRGTKPFHRLMAQSGIAFVSLAWLSLSMAGTLAWRLSFGMFVVVWIVAFVNAFNFMDGINGISVAQVIIAGGTWWVIGRSQHIPAFAVAGLVIAAAGLSFAPFNVPYGVMFLGDSGSYFLGGWLAATAVLGLRANLPPEAVIAPLLIYGGDTFSTLVRRIVRREPWYLPHRRHAYQRLVDGGWTQLQTLLATAVFIAACSALGTLSLGGLLERTIGDIGILAAVLIYLALPRFQERHGSNEAGSAPQ